MESTAAPVPIDQLLAHRAWLRRLARALVGDPQTADDLLQEVWVAAMERPPRHRRSLRGWLATVLRRKAIDRSRAAERRAHYEAQPPPRRPSASADELVAETEMQRRVTDALLALDEPYRCTLVQRYVGGQPIAEVARLQDVPVETVRTRLKRGIALLRKRLDLEHGGDRSAWTALLVPFAWPHKALGISTAAAATAAGGVLVGGKLAAVLMAVLVVALGAWASFELAGSDLETNGGFDGTALTALAHDASTDALAPVLEGRADEVTRTADADAGTARPPDGPAVERYEGPQAAPGRIAGRILGPGAKPFPNLTLVFERLDAEGMPVKGDGFPKYWGADRDGWFRLDDLPEGAYGVRVSAPGFVARHLEVPAGHDPLAITLAEAVRLSGRLVAEDPRITVAGIPLLARPEVSPVIGQAAYAESDAEGRFTFADLAPGRYLVRFGSRNLEGESPAARLVPIRVGPVVAGGDDVEIQLTLGDTIAGTIVDEQGDLVITPVRVEALGLTPDRQPDYARRCFGASTKEGTFELMGLARGRYRLSFDPIRREGERVLQGPRTTWVDDVASGTAELRVTLFDGLAVHGRLVDEEGEPVNGRGFVQVRPEGTVSGGEGTVILTVDEDGRFNTAPLDPGTVYVVSVGSFSGHMPKTVEGVIPSPEGLVVELADAGRITGRVLDPKGDPAAGVGVSARARAQPPDAEGRRGFAYVDPNGHFALEGLGDFEFHVQAGGASSGFVPAGAAVVLKAGRSDVVLRVKPGVPFSGRLVDEHDQPIQSPYVSATNGVLTWFTQVSDAEGRFRLPGVPAGKLRLGARIDGKYVDLGEIEAPAKDVTIRVPAR